METEDNNRFYYGPPESNVTLTCDSEDAIFISWIQNDVNIANGTNLTILGVVEDEFYYCRVWGPRCNMQLTYSVRVKPFGKIPAIFNHFLLSFARQRFRVNFYV